MLHDANALRLATNKLLDLKRIWGAPVGESTHADPDSFQHSIAGKLVHDERLENKLLKLFSKYYFMAI